MASETHFQRLETLMRGALAPPPGGGRIALVLTFGVAVHLVFAAAVAAMIFAMYFGMSRSIGSVPWPYASIANAFLVLQFPLVHSFLLTGPGVRMMRQRRTPSMQNTGHTDLCAEAFRVSGDGCNRLRRCLEQ